MSGYRERIEFVRSRMDPTSGDQAELRILREEVERLTNKLNADSQNFQIECQKAEIEMLRADLAAARAAKDAVVENAVGVLMGGCMKHGTTLSFQEFMDLGGGACPICLTAERDGLAKALLDTLAHLVAAISLLKAGGKAAKKGAPSDKMFDQMVRDYEASVERARAALAAPPREKA